MKPLNSKSGPEAALRKAVKNSGELLKWYKATAASPAPRIGLGDTAIPSITSTDLCDSLKQWLLSSNRSPGEHERTVEILRGLSAVQKCAF